MFRFYSRAVFTGWCTIRNRASLAFLSFLCIAKCRLPESHFHNFSPNFAEQNPISPPLIRQENGTDRTPWCCKHSSKHSRSILPAEMGRKQGLFSGDERQVRNNLEKPNNIMVVSQCICTGIVCGPSQHTYISQSCMKCVEAGVNIGRR